MGEIKQERGRPRKYASPEERLVAAATAAKAYRDRVRERKAMRKRVDIKPVSKIIDLQTSIAELLVNR